MARRCGSAGFCLFERMWQEDVVLPVCFFEVMWPGGVVLLVSVFLRQCDQRMCF